MILLRTLFNRRAEHSKFNRLTFAMLGVATPTQLIQDKNRTPFNIGKAIPLQGFKLHEAQPLLRGLSDKVSSPQIVLKEILYWTGGQPFLSQKICQIILSSNESIPINGESAWIENLVRTNIIDNWETQDEPEHLRTIRDRILSRGDNTSSILLEYQKVFKQERVPVRLIVEHNELLLSGLVVKEKEMLAVSNRIYQSIFNLDWIDKMLSFTVVQS